MKKYTLNIVDDYDPEDPRMWDNLGSMICFNFKYKLGDDHNYDSVFYALADIAGIDPENKIFDDLDDAERADLAFEKAYKKPLFYHFIYMIIAA